MAERRFDDDVLLRLSEYLDGTLDEATRARVEAELAGDPALRAELEALRSVDEAVQDAAKAVPDVDWERFGWEFTQRREAFEERRSAGRIFRILVPLAAAAAVIFAVSATLFYDFGGSSSVVVVQRQSGPVAEVDGPKELTVMRSETRVSVSVDRTPPPDVMATVGPAPRGRMVFVAVGPAVGEADEAAYADDSEALF